MSKRSAPEIEPQVWSPGTLADDPHAVPDKARRVRAMFAAIAPSYDLNNRVHSLGRDQSWRRAAVRVAGVRPGDVVLDAACGTGDLSLAFVRGGARRVLGVDFTFAMLPIARRKSPNAAVVYCNGDALRLPAADASVDIVSIAFGIRNVASPAAALAEFARVLRPGGRLVILEFSTPTHPLLRWGHRLYCGRIMPQTATWIARDRTGAYRYLPRSVDTFLDRGELVAAMTEAGFAEVTMKPLTFGIAVVYRGLRR